MCSPILNPEAKTPLATQGESIYSGKTQALVTLRTSDVRDEDLISVRSAARGAA
jgi:hypothetical protein